MEPVPVAEKLLKTKLFGFSLQRLIQSFAVPVAPGLILTVLNFPPLIYGPTVFAGAVVGMAVYVRTPAGQNPARWLFGMLEYYIGPKSYHWKPIKYDDGEVRIQDGDESFEEPDPEETQESSGLMGNDNTIENAHFEAIHDDGVIETEEAFSLIVEVEPRPWLILDNKSREAVYQSYMQFLMGIKSPIQIFTLPVPYDADEYIDSLKETNKNAPKEETDLLQYGRIQHANWLENVVDMGEIRDRKHYLVVTAQKFKKNEQAGGGGFLSKLKPSGGEVDQKKRYDELWSRAENVKTALPRTGVNTEIIDNREEVLQILYYYNKGREPPTNLEPAWLTEPAEMEVDTSKMAGQEAMI